MPFREIRRASGYVIEAISAVSSKDHFRRIDQAAKLLASAGSVLVMGVGGSSSVLADEAQNRLFRLGLQVVAHSDGYMQVMSAATLKKGDVLLIVSSTGKPATLLTSAAIARQAGAGCVVIAPAGSPLVAVADVHIPVELNRELLFQRPNPGIVSVFFVAALGFANAMMWPAIFPLSIRGLGRFTETGSALLIMGIMGGAIVPQLFAILNQWFDFQWVFLAIMLPSYLYILFFAHYCTRQPPS